MPVFNSLYAVAETAIFWDTEDCKIPDGLDAVAVWNNISKTLKNEGHRGKLSIRAYGDTKKEGANFHSAAASSGMELHYFSAGQEDGRAKKLLADFFFWAIKNPGPSNLMLLVGDVSEDQAFVKAFHFLKLQGYSILLAQPQNIHGVLLTIVTKTWLWGTISRGVNLITQSGISQGVEKPITQCGSSQGLDKPFTQSGSSLLVEKPITQSGISQPVDNTSASIGSPQCATPSPTSVGSGSRKSRRRRLMRQRQAQALEK